ncbi:MAG: hypothetical protein ABIO46_12160, partial [Chitinophagales bacterium]
GMTAPPDLLRQPPSSPLSSMIIILFENVFVKFNLDQILTGSKRFIFYCEYIPGSKKYCNPVSG